MGCPPAEKCFSKTFWGKTLKQSTHPHTHNCTNHVSGWQNYVPLRFHNLQGILFVIWRLGIVFSRNMPTTILLLQLQGTGIVLLTLAVISSQNYGGKQHPNSGILQPCPQDSQQTNQPKSLPEIGAFSSTKLRKDSDLFLLNMEVGLSWEPAAACKHHEKLCASVAVNRFLGCGISFWSLRFCICFERIQCLSLQYDSMHIGPRIKQNTNWQDFWATI